MATVMEVLGNAFVIQIGVAFYVIKVIQRVQLSISIEFYIHLSCSLSILH